MSQPSCISSLTGFPSVLRTWESGFRPEPTSSPRAWQWFCWMVSHPATPGRTSLRPPPKPAMSWVERAFRRMTLSGFRDAFIQPYFCTAGGHAHTGEHVFIPAVMLVHGNASRHFFSHTFDIFPLRCAPCGYPGRKR